MVFVTTEKSDSFHCSDSMSSIRKSDEERAVAVEVPPLSNEKTIGNPAPLAMGAFATTLISVSLAMMGFRGVSNQTLFVGDLCVAASFALLISGQWAMVKGDTFTYTVLCAFGLFYFGYGAIMIPSFGIVEAYGGYTPEYYNAFGFFVLIWAVLDLFFIIASLTYSFVYIGIFVTVELCLALEASALFAQADGKQATYVGLLKAAGVFGFIAGLLGFYTMAHYLFQDMFPFIVPMGDTSAFFKRRRQTKRVD